MEAQKRKKWVLFFLLFVYLPSIITYNVQQTKMTKITITIQPRIKILKLREDRAGRALRRLDSLIAKPLVYSRVFVLSYFLLSILNFRNKYIKIDRLVILVLFVWFLAIIKNT